VLVSQVEARFENVARIWHLHLASGQVIRTTAEHPFYVDGRGWVPADELRPGDLLVSHDGRRVAVAELYDTGTYERVYNLAIRSFHTYFVGCDEWGFSLWAHNLYNPTSAPAGLRPSNFGLRTISEDAALHRMWIDAMRAAATSTRPNGYTCYLQALERGETPSYQMLRDTFDAVNCRFLESARAAGHDIAQVHHWNSPIGNFPTQIVDPRHLVPVPSRAVHEAVHTATTSNPNTFIGIWGGPIAPQHQIPVPPWTTPLPPRAP